MNLTDLFGNFADKNVKFKNEIFPVIIVFRYISCFGSLISVVACICISVKSHGNTHIGW